MSETCASEWRLPEEIIRYSSLETSRIGALTGWKAPKPYSVIDEVFRERFDAVRAGSPAGRALGTKGRSARNKIACMNITSTGTGWIFF